MKITFRLPKEHKGGSGSGHYGHAGRPGKKGGSLPGTGSGGGFASSAIKKTGADTYFDMSKTVARESSHSTYESYSKAMWSSEARKADSRPNAKQTMVVHRDKKSGEYWARIMGGYSGSLNTWSTSKRHSSAEAAIEDAISNSRIPLRTGDILPLAPGIPMD